MSLNLIPYISSSDVGLFVNLLCNPNWPTTNETEKSDSIRALRKIPINEMHADAHDDHHWGRADMNDSQDDDDDKRANQNKYDMKWKQNQEQSGWLNSVYFRYDECKFRIEKKNPTM